MRYLSVCSGIEAATCAWHPLGWEPFAFSEIEPFPSAVLAHHYPNVPNLGDMTKFKEWPDATIDVLVGGTPCQSFSVAGLRKGLDDPRGNLMLTYLAIADKYRPTWLVWENVPGVLSSGGGRDFGSLLGGMAELGYGFAYRVLDAQFFGVAQRRRRVFVVGHLGDWRRSAAVLFERHSLQGTPAPSREAGKNIAPCLDVRAGRSGETTFHTSGGLVPSPHAQISPAIKARDSKGVSSDGDGDGDGAILVPMVLPFDTTQITSADNRSNPKYGDPFHPLQAQAHVPAIAFDCKASGQAGFGVGEIASTQRAIGHSGSHSNGGGHQAVCYSIAGNTIGRHDDAGPQGVGVGVSFTQTKSDVHAVAYGIDYEHNAHSMDDATGPLLKGSPSGGGHPLPAVSVSIRGREGGGTAELGDEVGQCLRASKGGGDKPHIMSSMAVRRLTPMECERLQGFADGYTQIPVRGKPAADGPRYKALGNSMAVPCMAWIGKRIALVDAIPLNESEAA